MEKEIKKVKEKIGLQETVDFLNELLKIDPIAITALFNIRIGCNKVLADHETVQVLVSGKNYYQVGMIGILNGLFGIDEYGWGHITINYDNGKIIEFQVLTEDEIKDFIEEK